MLRIYICCLISILFLFSCKPASSPETNTSTTIDEERDSLAITILHPHTLLKKSPEVDAENIMVLPKGSSVHPTGIISEHSTRLIINGIPYEEPWLLVKTTDQREGWIHGSVLKLDREENDLSVKKKIFEVLGEEGMTLLEHYQQTYIQATDVLSVAQLPIEARKLKVSLLAIINENELISMAPLLLSLLEGQLPGMQVFLLQDSPGLYLFLNFKELADKASKTDGQCDDRLFELYYHIYPIDSIEYFYPAWQLEGSPGKGFSVLGSSVHQSLLGELDELLVCEDVLRQEIDYIRGLIFNDLLHPDVLYWNSKDLAIAELQEIKDSELKCINKETRQQLENRILQLTTDSTKAGMLFNYRSGEKQY